MAGVGLGVRPQTPSQRPPRSAERLKKAVPWRGRGRSRREVLAGGALGSPRPGRGSGVSKAHAGGGSSRGLGWGLAVTFEEALPSPLAWVSVPASTLSSLAVWGLYLSLRLLVSNKGSG